MQDTRLSRTAAAFETAFGAAPTLFVQAPGRVNLIGEHTDYNDGLVLPCAIDYRTAIAAKPRSDRKVRVVAADYGDALDEYDLDAPIGRVDQPMWANYVRGVVEQFVKRGLPMQGMDMAIAGDVPQGAGLSSSASLSVAVGRLFATLPGFEALSPIDIALIAQASENDFVGTKCGNMDQISSACGVEGHALMIDCRSLEVKPVPVPDNAAIMIFNSNVTRGLVDSAYNVRREQCEAAARHFGIPALRDLDLALLTARAGELDPVVLRRARHVVTEDDRVLAAAAALESGDLERLGELMAASHASMRDDFEITVPAIDNLVDIVKNVIGTQGGVRMTGGGFGGCVVAVVPHALVDASRAAVEREYRSPDGKPATIYVCKPAAGAGKVNP
ncbi:galactokinase [Massilia sp. Root133]|uniref:galactokinase n=1 Tax=unclassified Massilia TaxID=2609279 RepID=UPI0006FAA08F|nr:MULTISPECIES: galactokinase [unclassified Massilia]KQY15738.1 galactokinase [Massilia sp. Root133]KQZ44468.1 galactokinase [Massilia sp. Root1485]